MSLPEIVNREEWTAARTALLEREKAATRARDALNADRRRLPMVKVDEDYRFIGPDGEVGLADLFGVHQQLIVGHMMFDPAWEDVCSSCAAGADELAPGLLEHLDARDTAYAVVSRAPYEKIAAARERHGWSFPWYSSHGSDFNADYGVTLTPGEHGTDSEHSTYNYRTGEEWAARGTPMVTDAPQEMPGLSVFLRHDTGVFHTYSVYGRGVEDLGGAYSWLDLTPLGRQEDWEEPKGRVESARGAVPDFAR